MEIVAQVEREQAEQQRIKEVLSPKCCSHDCSLSSRCQLWAAKSSGPNRLSRGAWWYCAASALSVIAALIFIYQSL